MAKYKALFSDQDKPWGSLKERSCDSEEDAARLVGQQLKLFELPWVDYQVDGGEIKTIYFNDACKSNRELLNQIKEGISNGVN